MEEYEEAFQEAALTILKAPNLRIGVYRAKLQAKYRYRRQKRREPASAWDGKSFQSCQFDPSIPRTLPRAE
jgi:hypothetical protein